jgi:hypothetical protein
MRGSPLLRAGLVLLALFALILPLRSLTSRRTAPTPPASTAAAPRSRVHLRIASTSVPFRFAISHLGKVIWEGECNENSRSKDLDLVFPREGIDLLVEATWPMEKLTAVRLEVERGADPPIAQTLWGTARIDDVVTFVPAP